MRYQISGKQIDIGDSLRTRVREELGAILEKYATRATNAVVTFSRSAHEFVCDVDVSLPTGLSTQARARATEIYAALDRCVDKMDKQLRRYRRRLKEHNSARNAPVEVFAGSAYILAASEAEDDTGGPDGLQPIIIAETEAQIARLSVGEAVMQMELNGAPLLVFRNEKQDRVNVVYRRDDGNIGWIDPGAA